MSKYWKSGFTKCRGFFFCDISRLYRFQLVVFYDPNSKIRTFFRIKQYHTNQAPKISHFKKRKNRFFTNVKQRIVQIFCLTWFYHHLLLRLFLHARNARLRELLWFCSDVCIAQQIIQSKGNCCECAGDGLLDQGQLHYLHAPKI